MKTWKYAAATLKLFKMSSVDSEPKYYNVNVLDAADKRCVWSTDFAVFEDIRDLNHVSDCSCNFEDISKP